jgi:HSP20 family protein
MTIKKEPALTRKEGPRDPLMMLRKMTTEFERMFEEPAWPVRWPFFAVRPFEATAWSPWIDVFEKDNRLVARLDLPGVKKENLKVEVTDGMLTISGERKNETEEKTEKYYRREREYGNFYRTVPLPEGVKFEEVKAMFADGTLEVSIPLPAKVEPHVRTVEIEGGEKKVKAA